MYEVATRFNLAIRAWPRGVADFAGIAIGKYDS